MRKPGSPQQLEQTRLIAASMFEQELTTRQIARSLGVDDQTVRRWRRVFRAEGRDGLLSSRHPGRTPLLDGSGRQKLAELLVKTPAECGFESHYLWTQQLIADLIRREFGITYHHDHVGRLLAKMGFTHQKPMRRARERDEQKIRAWRNEVWPALLRKVASVAG